MGMWGVTGWLLLLAAGALLLLRWRRDVRRLHTRMREMENRLAEQERRRQEFESAVDNYYIPHWQDAVSRLGEPPTCTCPPYPYRATCLQHSPDMARRQRQKLREIEERSMAMG